MAASNNNVPSELNKTIKSKKTDNSNNSVIISNENSESSNQSIESIENDIEFIFTTGLRTTSKLIYTTSEKQYYRKDKKYGENIFYYRCNAGNCPVRLCYNQDSNKCYRTKTTEHTHGDQEKLEKVVELRKSIRTDLTRMAGSIKQNRLSVNDVICENIRKTDLTVDMSKMVRSCYRYKSADLPSTPRTAEELKISFQNEEIMQRFGRSKVGVGETTTDLFRGVHVGDEFSYAVFASQRLIESIEKNISVSRRKYLMDATFKICPYGEFKQLLVIHIEYIESTIPFIFVLMNRKTEASYKHVFEFINTKVFSMNCNSFMTDYEVAMRSALRSCFPESALYSCWFHFCQACKRYASKIPGFVAKMRSNDTALNIYYRLLCLPLLPAANIEAAFRNLEAEAGNCDPILFTRFLAYFESQWIRKEGALNISVHGRSSRTTNALEAYNGVLGRKIGKKGHFFKFMEEIQDQEYSKRIDFENLIKSGGASALTKRTRSRDVKIKTANDKLSQLTITPDEFLRQVVYESSDVSNGLLDFNSVAANDDETIYPLSDAPSEEEISREPTAQTSETQSPSTSAIDRNSQPGPLNTCKICYDKQKQILLQPCGHFAVCQECFDSLVSIALSAPGPQSQKTRKKLRIVCPICRNLALVHMCLPVFNV